MLLMTAGEIIDRCEFYLELDILTPENRWQLILISNKATIRIEYSIIRRLEIKDLAENRNQIKNNQT